MVHFGELVFNPRQSMCDQIGISCPVAVEVVSLMCVVMPS